MKYASPLSTNIPITNQSRRIEQKSYSPSIVMLSPSFISMLTVPNGSTLFQLTCLQSSLARWECELLFLRDVTFSLLSPSPLALKYRYPTDRLLGIPRRSPFSPNAISSRLLDEWPPCRRLHACLLPWLTSFRGRIIKLSNDSTFH